MDIKKVKEESSLKIQRFAKKLEKMGVKGVIIVAFAEDKTCSVFLSCTGGDMLSAINALGEKLDMKLLAIPKPLFKKLTDEGQIKKLFDFPSDWKATA